MADKKNIIQTISEKEMDRKDFLRYSSLALLGFFGLGRVVNLINQSESKITVIEQKKELSRGFGSGKYGV